MPTAKTDIIRLRHPEYVKNLPKWSKFRQSYEGGQPFIDTFLERYSKRETVEDYQARRKLTYNPAHAKSVISIYRNSLAVKLPDVEREGSQEYLDAMATDVDLLRSSMSDFVATHVIPDLLSVAKVGVFVDMPPVPEGATRADDEELRPYLYTYKAEDILAWTMDHGPNSNRFLAVLLREWVEVPDEQSGLTIESKRQYRLFRKAEDGVRWRVYDDAGKQIDSGVLGIDRIPLVVLALPVSLMEDIADMQIALLNLNSTDMSFLWRVNFPLYVEQVDPEMESRDRMMQESEAELDESGNVISRAKAEIRAGAASGRIYYKDLEAPGFIAPPTDSVEISLRKQEAIIVQMRQIVDITLTSLSVKALEQSGESKEADRVGQDAAMAYIGGVLESGERDIAEIWHLYLGEENQPVDVSYPRDYKVTGTGDRIAEGKQLQDLRGAVRSPTYYREITKRIADVLLGDYSQEEDLLRIHEEIEEAPYFDADKSGAETLSVDLANNLITKSLASRIRGYPVGEAEAASAELVQEANLLAGQTDVNEG